MKKLDIIVPCFNEEESIPIFYNAIQAEKKNMPSILTKLIFINDGSKDNTLNVLRKLSENDENVKYISFSRNFGKESAMLSGMRFSTGDFVAIMDVDLQHSPTMLPEMLKAVKDDGFDVAAARRSDRIGEKKVRSAFSKGFYKIVNGISQTKIESGAQDFRIMKRKVVNAILSMPEYNRFSKGIFSWVGFKTKWFEHENRKRSAGKTKWSFGKLMKYASDGIIGYTDAPLRMSFWLGSLISFFGLIYAVIIFIKTIINGADVPGYPSLIIAILIIGGLTLISLGIVGEYISRIFFEVKKRPNYIIDETNITPNNK